MDVNTEGRVCVQIGVLGHPAAPFTSGPLDGVAAIVSWLDSWGVPRHWPAGQPTSSPGPGRGRALWALGGHFGASQVPGCASQGPGRADPSPLPPLPQGERGILPSPLAGEGGAKRRMRGRAASVDRRPRR